MDNVKFNFAKIHYFSGLFRFFGVYIQDGTMLA